MKLFYFNLFLVCIACWQPKGYSQNPLDKLVETEQIGDSLYNTKNYLEAAKAYTECISISEKYYIDSVKNKFPDNFMTFQISAIQLIEESIGSFYFKRAICRNKLQDYLGCIKDCTYAEFYSIKKYPEALYYEALARINDGQELSLICSKLKLAYQLGQYQVYQLMNSTCSASEIEQKYQTTPYDRLSSAEANKYIEYFNKFQTASKAHDYTNIIFYGLKISDLGCLDANVCNAIGWAYLLTKQFDKAQDMLLVGLNYDISSLYLWGNLAHSYLLSNDVVRALNIYLKFENLDLTNDISWRTMVQQDFSDFENIGIVIPYKYLVFDQLGIN